MKTIITILVTVLACLLIGGGAYYFVNRSEAPRDRGQETPATSTVSELPPPVEVDDTKTVIGQSADGQDIVAYHYGEGSDEVLFIGGIHGGYSWNTVLVAYELMDHLERDPSIIPSDLKVTIIPVLNPDGLRLAVGSSTIRFRAADVSTDEKVLVAGRFNGNEVDLNRNFACDWNSTATWQRRGVNPGGSAFSEPEAAAIRDYVSGRSLKAVVAWYSAAGGVFASSCHDGVLAETKTLTDIYAKASGYKAYQEFDFYEITGDMVNWLARENVPAISVLLTDHKNVEWDKNRQGIEAVLKHYSR